MSPTSVSLLDRLKAALRDASDWNRLQGIYLPLICRWLGRVPGVGDEADDLAQEVFVVMIERKFGYSGQVANSQEVTRGSGRPAGVILFFRCKSGSVAAFFIK